MKKWIVFLSISCAICIIILSFFFSHLHDSIMQYNTYKDVFSDIETENAREILSDQSKDIAITSILSFLVLALFVSNAFLLITISLRKITPLSISENLAAWKKHRSTRKAEKQQQKLEKAQAKVEQLQQEIKKDE